MVLPKMISSLCLMGLLTLVSANIQEPLKDNVAPDAQITAAPNGGILDDILPIFSNKGKVTSWIPKPLQCDPGMCNSECPCFMAGWPIPKSCPQNTTTTTPVAVTSAGTVTITQSCEDCVNDCCVTSTPIFPSSTWSQPPQPITIIASTPTRETIHRNGSNTATSSKGSIKPTPTFYKLNANTTIEAVKDITNDYYGFTVDGHHPHVIPIITEDSAQNQVTLLAMTSTTRLYSFISSGLVEQLGLSDQIQQGTTKLTDDQLTKVLGFPSKSPGTLSLHIIAGRNNRLLPNMSFIVFTPPQKRTGPMLNDITVGLEFLSKAQALRLTAEYAGQPAREEIGIVVQRVFGSGEKKSAEDMKIANTDNNNAVHDEL